jgi:hypothetical protein
MHRSWDRECRPDARAPSNPCKVPTAVVRSHKLRSAREHISIIRAGCERRGAGTSGRTAGSPSSGTSQGRRPSRASACSELRFRACAPICLPPLALASRGLLRCALVGLDHLARHRAPCPGERNTLAASRMGLLSRR